MRVNPFARSSRHSSVPRGAAEDSAPPTSRRLMAYAIGHIQVLVYSLGQAVRAPLSTLMTSAVIGISLALPTGLHLILQNVQQVTTRWEGAAQVSLFLEPELTEAEALKLAKELRDWPEIGDIDYVSRELALKEFRELSGFGDVLDVLQENPLPPVLIIRPSFGDLDPGDTRRLVEKLQHLPQVEIAQLDMQWLKRFDGMMEIGKRSVFVLAWLLAVAVLLIVGNTIRLSIQNRSEEIEVMQLVGATDAFIRRPFLYSGLWFGLLGGTIAWVLVSFSVWSLQKPVQHLANLYYSHFQLQTLDLSTSLWLLGLSTMLGLVGSWLAVSRHLHAIDS